MILAAKFFTVKRVGSVEQCSWELRLSIYLLTFRKTIQSKIEQKFCQEWYTLVLILKFPYSMAMCPLHMINMLGKTVGYWITSGEGCLIRDSRITNNKHTEKSIKFWEMQMHLLLYAIILLFHRHSLYFLYHCFATFFNLCISKVRWKALKWP